MQHNQKSLIAIPLSFNFCHVSALISSFIFALQSYYSPFIFHLCSHLFDLISCLIILRKALVSASHYFLCFFSFMESRYVFLSWQWCIYHMNFSCSSLKRSVHLIRVLRVFEILKWLGALTVLYYYNLFLFCQRTEVKDKRGVSSVTLKNRNIRANKKEHTNIQILKYYYL